MSNVEAVSLTWVSGLSTDNTLILIWTISVSLTPNHLAKTTSVTCLSRSDDITNAWGKSISQLCTGPVAQSGCQWGTAPRQFDTRRDVLFSCRCFCGSISVHVEKEECACRRQVICVYFRHPSPPFSLSLFKLALSSFYNRNYPRVSLPLSLSLSLSSSHRDKLLSSLPVVKVRTAVSNTSSTASQTPPC